MFETKKTCGDDFERRMEKEGLTSSGLSAFTVLTRGLTGQTGAPLTGATYCFPNKGNMNVCDQKEHMRHTDELR